MVVVSVVYVTAYCGLWSLCHGTSEEGAFGAGPYGCWYVWQPEDGGVLRGDLPSVSSDWLILLL